MFIIKMNLQISILNIHKTHKYVLAIAEIISCCNFFYIFIHIVARNVLIICSTYYNKFDLISYFLTQVF